MLTQKSDKFDAMVKVIIIGDSGVGKTNLITRFCEGHFKESYVATIGVDFKIKTCQYQQKKYKMQIWDTAGQERFKNVTQTYYKGAAGIVLTYSTIDKTSFENIERWVSQIQTHAPQNVSKVLIATKCDLKDSRMVSAEEGKNLAVKYGIPFMEVSAKEGTNVKEGFEKLIAQIHHRADIDGFDSIGSKRQIQIAKKDSSEKKNCSC